jgi:hypothetical protein
MMTWLSARDLGCGKLIGSDIDGSGTRLEMKPRLALEQHQGSVICGMRICMVIGRVIDTVSRVLAEIG